MRVSGLRLVAAVIVAIAVVQILLEDALIFLAATTETSIGVTSTVLIAVPLALMLLLFTVLFAAVIWSDPADRETPRRPPFEE